MAGHINDTEANICTATNSFQGRSWSCPWHAVIVCCTSDIKNYPLGWRRGAAGSTRDISEVFQQLGRCSQSSKKWRQFAREVCVSLMWVPLIQIHDTKAIKKRSKWWKQRKKGQIRWAATALITAIRSPSVRSTVQSGAGQQAYFLLALSSIKRSSVPAALPAWGLHLLQH